MVCFQMTSWLVGTKHFAESKTLPRIQKHFPKSKTLPRIQKHFPKSKTLSRIQKHFPESQNTSQNPKTRPRGGGVLVSGTCFWILGSVLSLRATVIRSDHAGGQEQKCSLECSEPNTLWMQIPRKKIVLCCVWRWGTPGRWGNLLRWGKKITPPLQAELRF